jgi:pimeloyl-ACP methyl ester carboxylesterase
MDRVLELLPQGRGAVIQDAAHVPNFSHPARLTALVRAFVENSEENR